ncbi:hypothetical protein P3T36_007652 [Kitasatospora sp. MAP12-15]|uniref:polyprenyl synthetase n=1 Tax=unclassified Kitasatospora TaxID=2633591 RepID=UPI0024748BDA|nr:polyprenyl synthetase [Kitasatospora sp. MAP12-44]MDH6108036.1 hypothetical protein [Kitasatospora sp. MAP12-44]
MPAQDASGVRADRGSDAVRILAGVVDLGLEQAEGLLRLTRGVLGRSDLREVVADGQEDLRARGELLLGRLAPATESHLEAVARRAAAARRPSSDA